MSDKFIENIFLLKKTISLILNIFLSFLLYYYFNIGLWIFIIDLLWIPESFREIKLFLTREKASGDGFK
jgi:hypothetical protein